MRTTENIAGPEAGTLAAPRNTLAALMSTGLPPASTAPAHSNSAPAHGSTALARSNTALAHDIPERARSSSALSQALTQGLNLPLLALRATMEALGQELAHERGAYPALRMDGVLREVDRLGKNVRELVDFASPPRPHALHCTLEEIVCAARAALAPEQRAHVVVARGEAGAAIEVDGPLLAACLRRLLENALEAGGENVLVAARLDGAQAAFSVIDDAQGDFAPEGTPDPFRTTKPNHLGLGLALVQRDVVLLNGRLEFLRTPRGETCVRITLPAAPSISLAIPLASTTLSIASLSIANPEKNR